MGSTETISWTFYDRQTLNNNTKQFFQTASGAATNGILDTNGYANGVLPPGYTFVVRGISVSLDADETLANAEGFLKNSALTLYINTKQYFQAMCLSLPAGGGLTGFYSQTTATTGALVNNGNPQVVAIYKISQLTIEANTPFVVEVKTLWSANTRVTVILHGTLTRPYG